MELLRTSIKNVINVKNAISHEAWIWRCCGELAATAWILTLAWEVPYAVGVTLKSKKKKKKKKKSLSVLKFLSDCQIHLSRSFSFSSCFIQGTSILGMCTTQFGILYSLLFFLFCLYFNFNFYLFIYLFLSFCYFLGRSRGIWRFPG